MPPSFIEVPSFTKILLQPSLNRWAAILLALLVICICLGLSAVIVYQTGGTKFAFTHIAYVPVLLAAVLFKVPGGLLAGIAAGLLLGPIMPLDVTSMVMQSPQNWMARLGFFTLIGSLAGFFIAALEHVQLRNRQGVLIDTFTGLPSRSSVEDYFCSNGAQNGASFMPRHTVAIDFDFFQQLVQVAGLGVADKFILEMTGHLKRITESSCVLVRIRTDLFVALLPAQGRGPAEFIEMCLSKLPQWMRLDALTIWIEPKFGAAQLLETDLRQGALFRKAMVAVDEAKSRGRQIVHFNESEDEQACSNLALLADLRRDLDQGRLEFHYQPKLSLRDGHILGAEALLRWHSPTRGPVPPGRFIPLTEKTLMINDITRWGLSQGARELAALREAGLPLTIGVNLSVRNLEDETLLSHIESLPSLYGIDPAAFELEITESAVMENVEAAASFLGRLGERGFIISLDDFGTGHSSLAYLRELPIDWLKIDASFIKKVPHDATSCDIVRTIIGLGKTLRFKIIAEGVENETVLDFLRSQGCDAAQGYHISKPLNAADFREWVKTQPLAKPVAYPLGI